MRGFFIAPQKNIYYKILCSGITCILTVSLTLMPSVAQAQSVLNLPIPGTMIQPSPAFVPVLLKGMTVHPENPFRFDFIIDSGNTNFTEDQIKQESEKLVKYFLASMTVPKNDLWVNLSPYENDRIIPEELGKTELGRDMLAQDYILKQLTASLMYPEKELGKRFWDKIYKKTGEQFGTTEIPVNTFNKVWILPETATVYAHGQTVYIVDAHLKVMLDSDYKTIKHEKRKKEAEISDNPSSTLDIQSSIIREIIIPEIEREVNQGEHFAPLRQIYHSLILAKWYKETVKNSLLNQVYADKNKIGGINVNDETIKDQIYAQYMEAYKKGVFNYIKEDYNKLNNETIPRKYFSGGELLTKVPLKVTQASSPIKESKNPKFKIGVSITPEGDKEKILSRLTRISKKSLLITGITLLTLGVGFGQAYGEYTEKVPAGITEQNYADSQLEEKIKKLIKFESSRYLYKEDQPDIIELVKIGKPAVPYLIEFIKNSLYKRSAPISQAIVTLGEIGPPAKDAIGVIEAYASTQSIYDINSFNSSFIVETVEKIDPESLARPGILPHVISLLQWASSHDEAVKRVLKIGKPALPYIFQYEVRTPYWATAEIFQGIGEPSIRFLKVGYKTKNRAISR